MLAAFSVNAIEVSPEIYQSYQRIQKAMERSPEEASAAVEQFYTFSKTQPETVKLLAANLYLQNCMVLTNYSCALQRIQEMVEYKLTPEQALNFNLLGAQLSYQQQLYPLTTSFLSRWFPVANSQLNKIKQTNPAQYKDKKTELANNYLFSAHAYLQQDKTELAIRDVLQALEIEQRKENDYRLLLSLYEKTQQKAKARGLLITMTKLFPANGDYWERLGYNYLENQEPKKALNILAAAFNSDILPDRSWPLLAQLYISQSVPHKAVTVLERAKEENRIKDTKAYYQILTNANLVGRDHSAVLKTLNTIEQIQQLTPAQLAQKAQIAFRLGKWQVAQKALTSLVTSEPTNAQWRFMLAICCYELKEYTLSNEHLRQVKAPEYDAIVQQWLKQIEYLNS